MVLHSRLRSWLTILGIVIGVASVIAIMSLGAGMEASISERLGGLGADIITLTAGVSRSSGMMGSGSIVTTSSIVGSLLVAIIVGMISGMIPAYQGSKLKPVDALRYE